MATFEELKERARSQSEARFAALKEQASAMKNAKDERDNTFEALKERAKSQTGYVTKHLQQAQDFFSTAQDYLAQAQSTDWVNAMNPENRQKRNTTLADFGTQSRQIRKWLTENEKSMDSSTYTNMLSALDELDSNLGAVSNEFGVVYSSGEKQQTNGGAVNFLNKAVQNAPGQLADAVEENVGADVRAALQEDIQTTMRKAEYQQKYEGKSYNELQTALDGLEDGEEKDWLSDYAPSVMTTQDYDDKISATNSEIMKMETVLEEYEKYNLMESTANPEAYANIRMREIRQQYGSKSNIERRIEELKAEKWNYENSKKYGFLSENADYAELSVDVADSPTAGFGYHIGDKWYGSGDQLYDYINDINGSRERLRMTGNDYSGWSQYDLMTEDEIANYNYLYNAQGKDSAEEYLTYLNYTLSERQQQKIAEENAQFATDLPIVSSTISIPANLLSGVGALDIAGQYVVKSIKEAVTGEYAGPINYNSSAMTPNTAATSIRGTVAQNIANDTGVIDLDEETHPVLSRILNGKSLADIYQLGMSAADSAVVAALSPVIGTTGGGALLSGSAATQRALNAVENGATDEQALAMGILGGIFEMVFEKYSLETLLSRDTSNIIEAVLRQGVAEGSEEFFTSAANNMADVLIMAEKSGYMQNVQKYRDQGFGDSEAVSKALTDMAIDMGWDFVGGMLTGGIMGGGTTATNNIAKYLNNDAQYRSIGGQINQSGDVDALQALANEMYGVTTGDTQQEILKQNENVSRKASDRNVGKLYEAVRSAVTEQNKTDFVNKMVEKGVQAETAEYVADTIIHTRSGAELSKEQEGILEYAASNSKILEAAMEVFGSENSAAYQREHSLQTSTLKKEENIQTAVHDDQSGEITQAEVKTATKEKVPENGYESDEENDYIPSAKNQVVTRDGTPVQLTSVADAGGGKLTVNLSDGTTIDVTELSFPEQGTQELYEKVAKVADSAEAARQLLNAYQEGNVSAAVYARGIEEAYLYGKLNFSRQEMMQKGTYVHQLDPVQQNTAYSIGHLYGERQAAQRQQELEAARRTGTGKKGQVHYDGDKNALTQRQRTSLTAIEAVTKALGIEVYVFESGRDAQGKRVGANGWYDPEDGSIHIDLYAGNNGEGVMLFTMAHELAHFIKDWSPAKYRMLASFLADQYGDKGISVRDMVLRQQAKAEEQGRELTFEEAHEEWVADSMETMLTDGAVIEKLSMLQAKDKSLVQKIRQWLNSFLKRLKDAYKGVKPQSVEGKIVASMVDKATQIRDLFTDALVDAGENYRTTEVQKNTTREGGEAKYSERYLAADTNSEILSMVERVANGEFKANEKVYLGNVSDTIAGQIYELTGIRVNGFKVAIEARQVDHILKDHGVNGAADHSMADPSNIAKMEFTLNSPDDIRKAGKTQAYLYMRDGKNRHADTVLYEKNIGAKSYYVVQAIPDTKAQTLYIVTAFIGKNGYKKEASQLINAKSLDATAKTEAASASNVNVAQNTDNVNENISAKDSDGKEKFSLREPVEYTKDLVALHNLTEEKLTKALNLGGFPMPSIAVTKADIPHTNFGEITLVFGRETIDPKANKKNVVYSADVWTPTFPQVEYEADSEVGYRINRQLDKLGSKVNDFFRDDLSRLKYGFEDSLDRYGGEDGLIQHAMENYGLKAAYLEEQGQHIEKVTTQKEVDRGFSPDAAEKYQKIMDILGVNDADEIGKLNLKEVRDDHGAELEAAFPGITKTAMRMGRIFGQVQKYLENKDAGPVYQTVTDGTATRQAVDTALDMAGFEAWTRNLFAGIVKDSGIYNNKEIFTPSGNRRSFKQTHLPVTLDNIVKAMAGQNGGSTKNVSGFNGIKTLRAGTAERFKSIEAMHLREGWLQNLTQEQQEAINDDLSSRLHSILEAIDKENGDHGERNSFIRYDTIGQIITEISEGSEYNVADIQQAFQQYSREISDDTALEVKQLLYDVSQMPVNIFEAKPERSIRFDEVKAAILPKGTNQSIVDGLQQNGVAVQFYETGNDTERLQLVNSVENVKFSDRDSDGNAFSDRAMLVDMFEQMVTNSNEYKVLQSYKNKMDEMLAVEEHLERVTAEIKRLSFAEGPKDMETLRKLKLQQAKAVNRLNLYDSKLLSLEKSGVLSAMIERNRKKITQQSFDKAREYYRTKNEKREAEIRQYYRESRRRAVERHDQSQIRQQIKKDVEKLDSLLNKGNKQKNVKQGLKEFAGAALRTARGTFLINYNEYDMVRNGVGVTLNREEKKIFAECQELIRQLDERAPLDSIQDPDEAMLWYQKEVEIKQKLQKRMKLLRDAGIFRDEVERTEDSTADELMSELLAAYGKLQEAEQAHVRGAYSDEIYAQIEKVQKFLKGKVIRDMTYTELKELYKMYHMVLHTITTSNDLFAQNRDADVQKLGEEVISQIKARGEGKTKQSAIMHHLKKIGWSELKPETAFEIIGSDTLSEMFQALYRGEDTYALDIDHARLYAQEQAEKYGKKKWNMDKLLSFAGTEITLGQAMSLYAYTKRKQAQGHLEGEGFTHSKNVRIKESADKIPVKISYIRNETRTYTVNREMYDQIGTLLTAEQIKYVDAMQDYLSHVMGTKGNEVSMKLYGIKLFEETAYFPLKTASEYQDEALGAKKGDVKLKNSGFTKAAKENASNPIVLDSFDNVWAAHVDKMSLYHGFVLPMEDFDRVYNYHKVIEQGVTDAAGEVYKTEFVNTNETVKVDIQSRWGEAANDYIETLMQQLNGGVRNDPTEKMFAGPMLKNFKKTAVLGSASVILQQPTAFIRAMAYLDAKDVITIKNRMGKTGKPDEKLVEEMYKYAPVALMKRIGGFDPGLGRSTRDYVIENKGGVLKWVDDRLSAAPEKMDQWTWTFIWLCTKHQIHRQNPELRVGSKEFLEKTGERFSQIIRSTQVYDSVLTKSQIMRSKNIFLQMASAFMNEPTTSIDMYVNAWIKCKRGKISAGSLARICASVIGSQLLCAAISAVVYAWRDNDDDEVYAEKYVSALINKGLENVLPWNLVPYVKDIGSVLSGYTVERSDMAIITDIYQGWQTWQSDNEEITPWERYESFAGSILNLFGVPAKNLSREVRGIYTTVKQLFDGNVTGTKAGMKYAALEGLTGKKASKAEQLQNAVAENDAAHILRVMATYDKEETAISAIRAAVKEEYALGAITDEMAADYLQVYGGYTQEDALDKVTLWSFENENPESELTDGPVLGYVEYAEPAGISLEVYTQYTEQAALCESDLDENGNTISGSRKEKILKVIDALPLTDDQKDALYWQNGWAENKLQDAPWH